MRKSIDNRRLFLETNPTTKRLKVETVGDLSETVVATLTPIFNSHFLYDKINTQQFLPQTAGSATVAVSASVCTLNVSSAFGFATLQSTTFLQYLSGAANLVRFSAIFGSGVVGNVRRVGLGTATNELTFGNNGAEFGVFHGSGGQQHEVEFTVSAAENTTDTYDVVLDDIPYVITLTNAGGDIGFTAHEISQKLSDDSDFTAAWHAINIDEVVIINSLRATDRSGTYSFTARALGSMVGAFATITNGELTTYAHTAATDCNINPNLIRSLDLSKGNVFQIKYTWLGFSQVEYSVLDPITGVMEPVHIIRHQNTATAPYIQNPHLPFLANNFNASNNTSVDLKLVSVGLFTQANIQRVHSPAFAINSTKTIAGSTEQTIFALKCRYSMGGLLMRSRMIIRHLTFATESTKNTIFKIIKNPTLVGAGTTGDYPDWQFHEENNSAALEDTTSLTHTGGTIVDDVVLAGGTSIVESFENGDLVLHQGDILLITAEFAGGGSADMTIAIQWVFDL